MSEIDHRNARRARIAFQIWQYASAREWNVTVAEIAEGIGENYASVRMMCIHRGWMARLRSLSAGLTEHGGNGLRFAASARLLTQDIIAGRVGSAE